MFLYILENEYLVSISCLKIGKTHNLKERLKQHNCNSYPNHKLIKFIELDNKYYNFAEYYLFRLILLNGFKKPNLREEFEIDIKSLNNILKIFQNSYVDIYERLYKIKSTIIKYQIEKTKKESQTNPRFMCYKSEFDKVEVLRDLETGFYNISYSLKNLEQLTNIHKEFYDFKTTKQHKQIIKHIKNDIGKNPIDKQHVPRRDDFRGHYIHEDLLTIVLSWSDSLYLLKVLKLIRNQRFKEDEQVINEAKKSKANLN